MQCALVLRSPSFPAAELEVRSALHDTTLEPAGSAIHALTDFSRDAALTASIDCPVLSALRDMMRLRVHALLATQKYRGDAMPRLAGLVTTYAIERRIRQRKRPAVGKRYSVRVGDVMTPVEELPLIKYESLQSLSALDCYAMFQGTGLTHLLVVDTHEPDWIEARGMLSRMDLARRLNRCACDIGPSHFTDQ